MDGFTDADTATLLAVRRNLLRGLDKVAVHLDAGTFETTGPKGSAPPSQSGHLTLLLLELVDAELADRAPSPGRAAS